MSLASCSQSTLSFGEWGIASAIGLEAASRRSGIDDTSDLNRNDALRLVSELSLDRGWFPLHDPPPANCLRQLHAGIAKTLCSHGKQRRFGSDGGLVWIKHHNLVHDLFDGRKAKITRAILPNWNDDGSRFPPESVLPLYFGILASIALPLPGSRAILAAPLAAESPGDPVAWCRAILPPVEDCWPASAGDALLSLLVRMNEAGQRADSAIGWVFAFKAGNKNFRQITAIARTTARNLEGWRRFADLTAPIEVPGKDFMVGDIVRGFAGDNIVRGRRAYDGFAEFSRGKQLRHLRRGSRAMLEALP